MFTFRKKLKSLLPPADTLPGRDAAIEVRETHFVSAHRIVPPFPDGMVQAQFGMGCFWGAERLFWRVSGVYSTAVGYSGGDTRNPTYEEVCSGFTNHAETVLVVFDPKRVAYDALLKVFWEGHDPTQGMRQGNDLGTQYRSTAYAYDAVQLKTALASRDAYQEALQQRGLGPISTEIREAPAFYYAEDHHQQYLGKNPDGYCGLGGTGVSCPAGALARA